MKEIFKAYDVRGLYPEEINERLVENIGKAYVAFMNAKTVAVACDKRASSPSLFAALKKGLTESGADVIDLGLLSTPMLYFASSKLDIDGAIMVTASHNPGQYNGLKFCKKNAVPIGLASGLAEIRDIALAGNFSPAQKIGMVTTHDIAEEYYKTIATFVDLKGKKFRIATDTAHAMGVLELPILERLPGVVSTGKLYNTLELPGVCPHEANPLKAETLIELQKKVKESNADIGIAYDGDADRIGFIDERGRIVPMDLVTTLLAQALLPRFPQALALYDLRSSRAVKEVIEKQGGAAHESKVGHANIKRQMIDEGAILAGEVSGHYYFSLIGYIAEMGTLPAILLMNLMAASGKKLSELVDDVHLYVHSGEINKESADAAAIFARVKTMYHDGKLSELDGVKIVYPTWWFSLRSSNTEPLIRLNLEADTQELMEEKRNELLRLIED
jgi:phosphomannomutase